MFEAKEDTIVSDLMSKICLQLYQNANDKPTFLAQFRANDIEEAKYILQHSDVNLAQLAARFRLDKFVFLRKFKHLTGMTPMRYQMIFRIAKAKKLLQTEMPLTHIAYECGFYDQSHFIHCFKKSEGMTPLSFRLS
ncbi:MAG: helix-turn-helix transcriptional regulator [Saprospiraceae bacterium]|nr:helix-turn-helix transcriptional regulator [Saprospiraceae bacterium]